jgi:hypothetical protein
LGLVSNKFKLKEKQPIKLLKIFSIFTIAAFAGIGAATGICALIGSSASSNYQNLQMKEQSIEKKDC